MGQALYRKYRSKKLSEVVGQEHITTTLAHALKKGNISHAYLFTGPRGVGKTSVARILAHEVNQLSYTDERSDLDIIEIDAASNRRIDEIRELRERVHVAPTNAAYKVYIIDEVHMLTKEAFNALLKTLEEPPAHVIFILATTEAHKVPETIISRTQRFSFKPVQLDKVAAHLRTIADKENIKIDDEALRLLAEYGEGSFRDSINLLDQARHQTKMVTLSDVQTLLGMPTAAALDDIITALADHDAAAVMDRLNGLNQQGFSAALTAKQLSSRLRQQLLEGHVLLPPNVTMVLIKDLLEIPAASQPQPRLELALLTSIFSTETLPEAIQPTPKETRIKPAPTRQNTAKIEKEQPETPSTREETLNEHVWQQVLSEIKSSHNTLYGVLRMARPTFNDDEIVLALQFAFHQKRLNESKNRQIIADTVERLSGQRVTIVCTVAGEAPLAKPETDKPESINTISNIFGGAELLES